ncbi:MAG TPA: FtsL-like putative cell division protein [Patescibacteria group bacterium]|nr:FtsL-like putative cell division protein [Patescibacteria group bacterium]
MVASCFKQNLNQEKSRRQCLLGYFGRIVILSFVAVLGIMYVVQTSSLSTKGFEISALEDQLQSLEYENQRLEFQIANQRSMSSIQSRLASLNLVNVDQVDYLRLPGSSVARR